MCKKVSTAIVSASVMLALLISEPGCSTRVQTGAQSVRPSSISVVQSKDVCLVLIYDTSGSYEKQLELAKRSSLLLLYNLREVPKYLTVLSFSADGKHCVHIDPTSGVSHQSKTKYGETIKYVLEKIKTVPERGTSPLSVLQAVPLHIPNGKCAVIMAMFSDGQIDDAAKKTHIEKAIQQIASDQRVLKFYLIGYDVRSEHASWWKETLTKSFGSDSRVSMMPCDSEEQVARPISYFVNSLLE